MFTGGSDGSVDATGCGVNPLEDDDVITIFGVGGSGKPTTTAPESTALVTEAVFTGGSARTIVATGCEVKGRWIVVAVAIPSIGRGCDGCGVTATLLTIPGLNVPGTFESSPESFVETGLFCPPAVVTDPGLS